MSTLLDRMQDLMQAHPQAEQVNNLDQDVAVLVRAGVTEPESILPLLRLCKRAEIPKADVEVWLQNLPDPTADTPTIFHKQRLLAEFRRIYS